MLELKYTICKKIFKRPYNIDNFICGNCIYESELQSYKLGRYL